MPRGDATIFHDLIGKLTAIPVTRDKCGSTGHYRLQSLIRARGGGKVID